MLIPAIIQINNVVVVAVGVGVVGVVVGVGVVVVVVGYRMVQS